MKKYCALKLEKLLSGCRFEYRQGISIKIYKYDNKVYFDKFILTPYIPWYDIYVDFWFEICEPLENFFSNIEIYVDDFNAVLNYIERQLSFGEIYHCLEYDSVVLFKNMIEKAKVIHNYTYSEYRIILFSLYLIFIYNMNPNNDIFSITEVDRVPWTALELNFINIYSHLLDIILINVTWNSKIRYSDEIIGYFYIKNIDKYMETTYKLNDFLCNFGFYGTKLIVKSRMYYDGVVKDKNKNYIDINELCLNKPLLNFSDNNKNYESFFGDNEIVFLTLDQEFNDRYKNYYKVEYDNIPLLTTLQPMRILFSLRGRIEEDYNLIDNLYLFSALLMFTSLNLDEPDTEYDFFPPRELSYFKYTWLVEELLRYYKELKVSGDV